MRKELVAAVMVGAIGAIAAGISGSKHDLRDTNATGYNQTGDAGAPWTEKEICRPCHIPHGGSTTGMLWSHTSTTSALTATYTTQTGQTTNVDNITTKMCMSCHDGSVAVDAYDGMAGDNANKLTGDALVGLDMSNDHPVGVTKPAGYGTPTTVKYIGDKVECGSCHDVHEAGDFTGTTWDGKFLRATMEDSALCQDCHNK